MRDGGPTVLGLKQDGVPISTLAVGRGNKNKDPNFGIMTSNKLTRPIIMHSSGEPLDNPTWQTEWKTVPLAKVQLCEYENQTLEAFVAASRLYAKFDCPVARQNCPLLATAHDCETGLLE